MAEHAAVTDADFETQVLKSDKPVLVDFWAEWCGPCRQVAPILEEIAADHGDKITFLKMNVDENPVTPSSYRVTGIPTINVYQGGEVVKSIVGREAQGGAPQRARRLHRLSLARPGSLSSAAVRAGHLRGRTHRADRPDQPLQRRLHLGAPGDGGAQVHPHPRGGAVCALGLEAHAAEEVRREHAGSSGPRVSPNASTARMSRSTRSRAIPWTSIRPSPPRRWPGSTYAVVSSTASGETGAVGKPAAPGTNASGA